ncbi:nuclear transport factor 2 family protein [Streptomyces antimycoticus]
MAEAENTGPVAVARSYWAAESDRNLEGVLRHYHEDATFTYPGGVLKGHDQISGYYRDSGERFPGLTVEIGNALVDGTHAAIEWTAVMTGPDGVGHPLRGVNVVSVEEGRFREVRAYFDPATLEQRV